MNTIYALEHTAKTRIAEFHQQKAQQNLGALVSARDESPTVAFIRAALKTKYSAVMTMLLVSLLFGFQAWINQAAIHASNALPFNSERNRFR